MYVLGIGISVKNFFSNFEISKVLVILLLRLIKIISTSLGSGHNIYFTIDSIMCTLPLWNLQSGVWVGKVAIQLLIV